MASMSALIINALTPVKSAGFTINSIKTFLSLHPSNKTNTRMFVLTFKHVYTAERGIEKGREGWSSAIRRLGRVTNAFSN